MSAYTRRQVRQTFMFRDRLIEALAKRLYPRGSLHRKVLAGALGVHGDTFNRWMRGEGSPTSEMTAELVRFFWSRGDRAFANEIFDLDVPSVTPPPSAPVAAALAALDQARQALLEGAAA